MLRLINNTYLGEVRDKAADRTEWQCLIEKLGETTGEVDDYDESTAEAEDLCGKYRISYLSINES